MVYVPLFQACILNFNEKMMAFHNIDMTAIIPQNFLSLSVSMKALSETEIVAKYPEEIANKLLDIKNKIDDLSVNNNLQASILQISVNILESKRMDVFAIFINIFLRLNIHTLYKL